MRVLNLSKSWLAWIISCIIGACVRKAASHDGLDFQWLVKRKFVEFFWISWAWSVIVWVALIALNIISVGKTNPVIKIDMAVINIFLEIVRRPRKWGKKQKGGLERVKRKKRWWVRKGFFIGICSCYDCEYVSVWLLQVGVPVGSRWANDKINVRKAAGLIRAPAN